MSTTDRPLFETNGVCISYGKARALHEVSLRVNPGEIVAVIGPNGAGKTTLFSAISGLVDYEGTIRFKGDSLPVEEPVETVRRGIIHCPEGRHLFPYLSVRDNLTLGAYRRADRDGIGTDLDRIYRLFPQLQERRNQTARTLSGGEQQMLAIGRALMGHPELLLLDEPTLGLAPIVRNDIGKAIQEIQDSGVTVLLAEQNLVFSFELADRIYLLEVGRIVCESRPEELKKAPRVREAYLGL
ncbi:MAG: ABC transporter ATP-binding protein [Candidatus Bipolaricaulia bacterium]